jgi:hypothetical protein
VFHGQQINHQYSKTFEFELAFRQYLHQFVTTSVEYFSWLRPLHEIQIAQLFSDFSQYFPVFLSCNRGQKTGKWCGECPKCVFVYVMLSAFLLPSEVEAIWHKNLMADPALRPILAELTGQTEVKSFECVGTRQETIIALQIALQKYPKLVEYPLWKFAQEILKENEAFVTRSQITSFMDQYQNDSLIPVIFRDVLQQAIKARKSYDTD